MLKCYSFNSQQKRVKSYFITLYMAKHNPAKLTRPPAIPPAISPSCEIVEDTVVEEVVVVEEIDVVVVEEIVVVVDEEIVVVVEKVVVVEGSPHL